MPHIHTQPGQHDMTVSAYVIRRQDNEWRCLVHWHKKMGLLAQVGGHIELDQTPWQALAAELSEESGYQLYEVQILQPPGARTVAVDNVAHPVPFVMNTHYVGDEHYHSDLCYGLVAADPPKAAPADNESDDLRWYSLSEIEALSERGEAISDMVEMYRLLIEYAKSYDKVDASSFSIAKPAKATVTYKSGKPSESRNL